MSRKPGTLSNRIISRIFGTGFLGSKKRVFLSYCLALLLPCILIVLFVQSNYIHRIQTNYEDGITQHVQMISNDVDNIYSDIESIVHSLCMDKKTEWESAPWKPNEYNSLVEKLTYYSSDIEGLDEIVVFDETNSYLMSSLSSSSYERFLMLHEIDGFNSGKEFREYLLRCSTWDTFHASYNGNKYICFVYPVRDPSKSSRALLFLIKDSSLISMLSNALIDGEGFVAMYDREGSLLLSTGTSNSNALISHVVSRSYPFSYETRIDTGTFVHEIRMLKQNWGLVLLLTILTGICSAVTLTYASFKPLEKISHHLSAGNNSEDYPDTSYEDVIQAVDTMRIQMTTLRSYYRSTQTHFIEKLIYGDTEDGTVLRVLQNTFDLPPVVFEWQVAVIETNIQTDFYELQSQLASSLPRGIVPLFCERKQSNRSAIVLAYCNSIPDVIQIESNLREIKSVDRIALSQKIKKVEDIPYAYVEASVLFLDHFSVPRDRISDEEPFQSLYNAVQRGSNDEINASLESFVKYLVSPEANIPLCRLFAILLLYECRLRLTKEGCNTGALGTFSIVPDLLLPVSEWMSEWCDLISFCAATLNSTAKEESPSIETICDYLKGKCCGADFSVQKVAEHFGMSSASLSTFFKTHMNNTVLQYVTDYKMELAKKLLINTDTSVYDIGLQLGYYGPNSFIRRFKATIGMTPGEYRDAQQLAGPISSKDID